MTENGKPSQSHGPSRQPAREAVRVPSSPWTPRSPRWRGLTLLFRSSLTPAQRGAVGTEQGCWGTPQACWCQGPVPADFRQDRAQTWGPCRGGRLSGAHSLVRATAAAGRGLRGGEGSGLEASEATAGTRVFPVSSAIVLRGEDGFASGRLDLGGCPIPYSFSNNLGRIWQPTRVTGSPPSLGGVPRMQGCRKRGPPSYRPARGCPRAAGVPSLVLLLWEDRSFPVVLMAAPRWNRAPGPGLSLPSGALPGPERTQGREQQQMQMSCCMLLITSIAQEQIEK